MDTNDRALYICDKRKVLGKEGLEGARKERREKERREKERKKERKKKKEKRKDVKISVFDKMLI